MSAMCKSASMGGDEEVMRGTGCARIDDAAAFCPGGCCGGGGAVLIRTIHGCASMMGVGGVVRNADTRVGDPVAGSQRGGHTTKGTRHTNGCVAGACV